MGGDTQLVQTHIAVSPEIAEALTKTGQDAGFDVAGVAAIVDLELKKDDVPQATVLDHDLPVVSDAGNASQQLVEHPRPDIAHPAHHHLVAPAADLGDESHRNYEH